MLRWSPALLLVLMACDPAPVPSHPAPPVNEPGEETAAPQLLDTAVDAPAEDRVEDLAAGTDFDLNEDGERTRAIVAADFDNDGLDDLFVGNPGDASYILLNVSQPGVARFEVAQVLSEDHLSWTAAAADFDNDGDVDLMVGGGGNECQAVDQLWRNQLVEKGTVTFIEVRETMGLTRDADLDRAATTGVKWADFDRDGWLDLYISHNADPRCGSTASYSAENQLWRNVDGQRFENITQATGIDLVPLGSTRHPAILDLDGDGDLDIFDSNMQGENQFLNNLLVETGELAFGSMDPFEDGFSGPRRAFASCAGDFDNDGHDDLLVVNRVASECSVATGESTAAEMHAVLRNTGAGTLQNASDEAGLVVKAIGAKNGVMGCQVGDLDGDGSLDVFIGNGGPESPAGNDLFLGSSEGIAFTDRSELVQANRGRRTHGSVIADIDGDGIPELVIGNGGPSTYNNVEEPNRVLRFEWKHEAAYLKLRLHGDGSKVNRDAIGARAELVFVDGDGQQTRSLFRTVRGGSCFSADNGRALYFGLGRSVEAGDEVPHHLNILWPDGTKSSHGVSLQAGASGTMSVDYGE